MAQQEVKKKKGHPLQILPNKQIMPLQGLGTYKLNDSQIILQLLRKGLQQGSCKHIDTARLYNNQIPLGKAIKTVIEQGRVKRQQLFIASKIYNLKGQSVQKEVKQSLQLMQLKYIDLLYLHWPYVGLSENGQFNHKPLEQIWEEMQLCVTKGYVKHLGVSNFNGQLLMELLTFVKIKPIALQVEIHPYLPNNALVQLAQKNGIIVIAYSPLVRGDNLVNEEDINILKEEIIQQIAAKHGKTPAQIILKSTLQRGIGVIPKTCNPQRLQQNWQAWNVQLGQDDMKKIRTLARGFKICYSIDSLKNLPIFD